MSKDRRAGRRKAGEPGRRKSEPRLRLLKPRSGCSTPELASEMPLVLLSALRKRGRKRQAGETFAECPR